MKTPVTLDGFSSRLPALLRRPESCRICRTRPRDVDVIVQYTAAPTARHHEKVFSRGGALRRDLAASSKDGLLRAASAIPILRKIPMSCT